jgi:uncharacterized RDD family membrane protein YckC
MTNPSSPPPGWYYAQGDPPGTNRWWDGATWVGGPTAGYGWTPGAATPGSAGPYGYAVGQGYGIPRVLAGFWQRVGATIIDGLILGVPGAIVGGIFFALSPTEQRPCSINGRRALCEGPTDAAIAVILLASVVIGVLSVILYYGQLEGKTGQTVGKRALGIKTVRTLTGEPPGVGRAIGRTFAHYLSALPCYLGYLWMLWDRDKQTWHDKISDTVVIKASGF